jgi:hypothetical protein
MAEQLTLYVAIAGDSKQETKQRAEELAAAIRGLDSVADAKAMVEGKVRGPAADLLNEITVFVTSAGGLVGATTVLLGQVQELLRKFPVRSAQMDTPEGRRELPVGGEPRNENPAQ